MKYEGVAEAVVYLLNRGKETSLPREYLGMSQIGAECPRMLWYYFHWTQKLELKWQVKRIFSMGNAVEKIIVDELKRIGFEITGTQLELTAADGFIRGHVDGIVTGLPDHEEVSFLLEVKSMKAAKWKAFVKNSFAATYSEYFAQIQIYMHLLDLPACLYVIMNKDTSEIHCEIVKYQKEKAEDFLQKAHDIVYSKYPPAKCTEDPAYYKCGWCDFYNVCWIEEPFLKTCRTCKLVKKEEGKWICSHKVQTLSAEQQMKTCNEYDMLEC